MLREIYLRDFRNYFEERILLERGINVVYGENGQGKTNLLEAIFFCMRGESFRVAGNRELVKEDAGFGVVITRFEEKETIRTLARQICEDGSVRTKLDGKEKRVRMENLVVFSQEDLAVIKGDPQKRREFIDDQATRLDRVFRDKNMQFKKALYQRNETLKRIRKGEAGRDALSVWEEILVERGSYLVEKRKELLHELASRVDGRLRDAGEGEMSVKYYGTFEDAGDYREKLEKNRDKEIARGTTVTGPHRDEMIFFLNGRNLKTKGSQGQQRKAAILFKVAVAEMIEEKVGKGCILLLDDMPSELDSHNTSWLMGVLQEKEQSVITVNPNRLGELGGAARYLHIEEGKLL